MTDRYADIRAALEQKCSAIFIEDVDAIRALLAERDALRAALAAAVDCGMVPKSSASDGGASARVRQVIVADMIRAALAQHQGEKHVDQ